MLKNNGRRQLGAAILFALALCAMLSGCSDFVRQPAVAPVLTAPIANAKPLPLSMKGYELYSWHDERGEGWRHTLMTGTNRLKGYEEIAADEDQVTESGWVKITAAGTEELKALLKRLPPGSYVTWGSGKRLMGEPSKTVTVMLPESAVIEAIQRHGRQLEIQLQLDR